MPHTRYIHKKKFPLNARFFIALLLICIFHNILRSQSISGIINTYYPVTETDHCSNSVTVLNASGLSVGDKVLVIQIKGAVIDTTNTPNSGSVLNIAEAGNYEYAIIDSMSGNKLIFRDSLVYSYHVNTDTVKDSIVQVVNIPQYTDVTISGTLTCLKWDGTIGGILIFEASGNVTMNAAIDLSGKGFRGRDMFTCSANPPQVPPQPIYASPCIPRDVKGEGISELDENHTGGRGTIANGGGAGGQQPAIAGLSDAFYNGGGGGGNYGAGGEGGKSTTVYTTQYPGGLGGKALSSYVSSNKIFMGGGGGSGHRRYSTAGPSNGTDGAGIVIINAGTLTGNNQNILADGIDNAGIYNNTGRGGGGAGGSVLLNINNFSGNVNISVKGGKGGDNSGGQYVGPGGGGGGGLIYIKSASVPANIIYNISGGLNGLQMTHGNAWGATAGQPGAILTNLVIPQGQNEFVFLTTVTNASGTSPVCQDSTISLFGGTIPGNTAYSWSGPNGFTSSLQNPQILNALPVNSGTYQLNVLINGCPGPPVNVPVTVHPRPSIPTILNQSICFGTPVPTLVDTSNCPGTVNWYNSPSLNPSINTGNSYTPGVSSVGVYSYYITHTQNNCPSPPDTATLTIYAIPSAPVANNQTVCQGNPVPNLSASGTGTIKWYNNPNLLTPVYTGNPYATGQTAPGVYTYYVTQTINNCESLPDTVTLTINAIPVVTQKSNIAVCPGSPINIGNFVSTPSGATFAWTNSNTNIGLAAGGTGNIAQWNAPPNSTGSNITGTISVIPTLNGCTGTAMTFTVTIYPNSTVNQISNIVVCPGTLINVGNFVSNPSGASFSWTNSNTAIGIAASGTGNIPQWNAGANATGANIMGTITVTPTLNGCAGTPMSFTVTIYPTPSVNTISNISVCPGAPISIGNFVSSPTGSTFAWTNSNTAIGIAATGSGNIPTWNAPANGTGSNIAGTINVTPTLNGCTGTPMSFTVTIKPTPTVNSVSNVSACPGAPINIASFTSNPTGSNFNWSNSNTLIGLAASGTGDIIPWSAPNNMTGVNITGTITVTPTLNACSGTSTNFTVTIYPTPTTNAVSNISVCPGSTINPGAFTSSPTGSSFSWVNSNTAIGISASGTGNIPQWNAPPNGTGSNITGNITVTPTLNGCTGNPANFTVTIYPTPTVNQITNIAVCPGSPINIGNFVSVPTGATFSWVNTNTNIGLAATGTGNIPQWNAPANGTGSSIVGTITVTPSQNGCQGIPMIFTVTIYPTPSANQISNVAVCPGATISLPNFGSVPAGSSFSWINSNTSIGLAASGNGNINSWAAPANSTAANITGTITVTPTLNGCTGTSMSFTVTIYPTPAANAIPNITVCPGNPVNIGNFSSTPSGSSFTWTNSNTAIGISASGTGNIPQWNASANSSGSNISGIITFTPTLNGCPGTSSNLTITIKPTPSVSQLTNIAVCPDATINIPGFSSNPTGADYTWTNTNTSIGLTSSGSGNISSWNAPTNTTGSDITGTISVTGTLNACPSQPMNFTVTVYTAPIVNSIADVTECPGNVIDVGSFSSQPTGSTFTWTNSNTNIGIAASGSGDIPPWNAPANSTGVAISGTITVTPSSTFSCIGVPRDFSVTINPTPEVTQHTDVFVCPGQTINIPAFVSTPSGATFTWTNSNTAIGLATSGTGNISSWVAPVNGTSNNITGTIAVTPLLNGCNGPAMIFSVIIRPVPVVTQISNINVCPGFPVNIGNFSSTPTGATFNWTNTNTTIGLIGSGTGNISPWNAPLNSTGSNITGTISVIPELNGCIGTAMSFDVAVLPTPIQNSISNITVCPGNPINIGNFVSIPTGANFNWTNSNTAIGIAASGSGNIPQWNAPANTTGVDISAVIQVTPELNTCLGAPVSFNITIKPTPAITSVSNIGVCPGDAINIGSFSSTPSGATFDWTNTNTAIGIAAGGIGDIPSWNAPTNTTGADITGNISVLATLNSCVSNPLNFTVTIYTSPIVNPIADVTECPGNVIDVGSFTSLPTGSTFTWVNSNTGIGIAASGSGDIPPWNAPANATGVAITGVITVTPSSTFSCIGTTLDFNVTINPTPEIDPMTDIFVCPGQTITIPAFISTPSGATFTWTNTNTAIGLNASGSGNISAWAAPPNSTNADITGTISVIPHLNGCDGPPMTFNVTVYPTPAATQVSNITVCPGLPVNIGNFSSTPAGATYTWTNSNTAIGIAGSGSGDIPSWNAPANSTGSDISGTISVIPSFNGCNGPSMDFNIIISPTPEQDAVSDIIVCPGDAINVGNFISTPSGATFNWTNSNTAIGIAAGGSGNIPQWNAPANTSGVDISAIIQVTPELSTCLGTPVSFNITIKPTPAITSISNIGVCPGDAINIGSFSSTPSGATFDWTNTNTAIGIAAGGTGDIPSWNAPSNTTGADITGNISVLATLNGCVSNPMSFTVTIYTSPIVNPIADVTECPGNVIDVGSFTSLPTGSTFTWVNSNTNIGIAAGGSGDIPPWNAPANATGIAITGIITVTPSSTFSCVGTPLDFSVTINPTPEADQIPDTAVCPGIMISISAFNSIPSGATYTWTNSNTAIGLAASGTGNISSWPAPTNSTGADITGTISVIPHLNGCDGPPMNINITIYPTPTAPISNNEESCFGFPVPELIANASGTIQWYDDASLSPPVLNTGSNFNTGQTVVGTYFYYVTQTVNNCESPATEVSLTIYPIPAAPQSNNEDVCFGSPVPDLNAIGTGTISWFDNIALTPPPVFTGATFPTGETTVGSYTYYVIQTENNCQSPYTEVILNIYPVPAAPQSQDEEECEGYPIPPLVAQGTGLLQWYDNASLITPAVFTGDTFVTGHTVPGTYVYYVTQTENNCESLATEVTLTIHPTPLPPASTNISSCFGYSIPDLTATGTGTLQWYDDIGLTNLVFTGANFPTGQTTIGTYTYYVTQTVNNCQSPATTVTLSIYPIPSVPLANDVEVCAGQTVPDLTASGNGIIQWYDNPALIPPVIQTGTSYTTGQTTAGIYTYYITQVENNCESPSDTVVLTIYPIPSAPQTTNIETCYGFPVPDLTATGTGTIQWYNNPSGIPPVLYTGSDFATGHTGVGIYNYYATQTVNNCESPVAQVTLTIHPIPLAPLSNDVTVCFGDTSVPHFTTNATGDIKWYDDSLLTPPVLQTGPSFNSGETNVGVYDYYLTQTVNSCESPPSAVYLTINPVPPPPTASDSSSCFGQPVPDLQADGTGVIQWYTDPSLTPPPVNIGSVFATGQTSSGTYIYYVTQLENGCESQATEVTLTIITLPQPPVANNVGICFGQSTPTLTATATGIINWYDNISLTPPPVFTGASFATGQTNVGTYTYYVTQTHNTTGCQSLPDTVVLNIYPIPQAPVALDLVSCTGQPTPDFTATATGTLNWYNSPTLITPVFTGNNFASGHTTAGTYTYYVTQTENNCQGSADTVTLTINQTPAAPLVNNDSACFGSAIPSLTAIGTGTIKWYSNISLTNLLFTGSTFNTGQTAVGVYTYYVTQTENNCESPYSIVTLTINPIPAAPVASDEDACFGFQIPDLTATASGTTQWYDNPNLTPPAIYSGNIYATGQTAVGTYTYYITQLVNGCEGPSDTVALTIYPIPQAPQATDVNVCYGLPTPDLTATGTGTINWYDDLALTPPPSYTGSSFATGHTAVGIYPYYVTQTENNCVSPYTLVNLNIISLPAAPVSNNVEVCFGIPTPNLTATATGTIDWFTSGTLTPPPVFTGGNFATGQTAVGTYTYYVTQTNVATTCQSLADTVILTIHPIPSAPVSHDTSSCFGFSTPNLTATGTGTINWYNNVTLPQPSLFTGITYTTGQNAVGTYTYYVTQTVNNCQSAPDTVNLTIYPIPAAPVVSVNNPICEGDSILFDADSVLNATYSWTGPSAFVSSQQYPFISPSTVANGGQYGLTVIVNGCSSPVTNANVVIIPALTPNISGNAPFCQGQSTDLDAGIFDSYLWSTGDTTQIITVTNAGTYSVTVYDANGCSATDTVIATFSTPPPANAGVDTGLCLNGSIQLQATGGVIYDWSPSTGLNNSGISNPVATPTVTTTYTLVVLDAAGCSGTDDIVVTVHPLPTVQFSTNVATGCEPLVVEFNDFSTPNVVAWAWDFGDNLSGVNNTSAIQNPTHIYQYKGTYSVTLSVTTIYGCTAQIVQPNLITVYPVPVADFTFYPEQADINNPVITFINQSTNDNAWTWDFDDNSSNIYTPNAVHEFLEPGTYEVMLIVQSTLGCVDTAMREVIFKPFYTLYVPNAFTPNDDGLNDFFYPEGVGLDNENFNFYIYNRWGELVFETNDINKGWDGNTFEGNPAPEAVYTWIILLRTKDGSDFLYRHKGHVSLLRTK